MRGMRDRGEVPGGHEVSLPSLAEVEHADWPSLKRIAASLGLNPKGRSAVVRTRVLDHVRRRFRAEPWRPDPASQAALLTRLGFPEDAARTWESTIQLDAPAPWIGLGRSYLVAGELQEAAKAFDRAAQMGDAVAHLHRAEALAAGGNPEAAVRECEAFLAARPGDLRGLMMKAGFLGRGGWTDEAAAVVRTAFVSHPRAEGLWRGLGLLLLKGGRAEAAAEALHEAVRSDPADEISWIDRGASLLIVGRQREAVGAFREVLESDPRQAVALNNLGVAYLKAGQAKSAVVNLERAAKHLEIPSVLLNVARVQEAAHERREALATYERVLRLRPRNAEASAGKKRLLTARSPRRVAKRRLPHRPKRAPPRRKRTRIRAKPVRRRKAASVKPRRKVRLPVRRKPKAGAKPRRKPTVKPRAKSRRRPSTRRR